MDSYSIRIDGYRLLVQTHYEFDRILRRLMKAVVCHDERVDLLCAHVVVTCVMPDNKVQ